VLSRDAARDPPAKWCSTMNTRTALILLAMGAAYLADPFAQVLAQRASVNANVGGLQGGGGVGGVNGVTSGSSSLGGLQGGGGVGGVTGVGTYRGGGAVGGVSGVRVGEGTGETAAGGGGGGGGGGAVGEGGIGR
jgi:hypothetical protein